jgi:signal transduction histidine kinase
MQNVSLDRLRQVANLARSVASALDVDTVLRQVVDAVLLLRPRAFCAVRLVDVEQGGYRLAAKGGGGHEGEADVESMAALIPFGHGITHAVAQSGQPLLLPDALGDPRLVGALWREEHGPRVYYGVPISAGGELMGVLNIALSETAPPTEEERAIVDLLASHAAVAIGNARVFADAERRRVEAETLAALERTISASLDLESVLRHVAAAARQLCASDIALIVLRDADTDTMFTRYGEGHAMDDAEAPHIERGKGAGGQAWSTGRPFRTANRPDDPRVRGDYPEAVKREGVIATLVVPIWISGLIEGLLYVANRRNVPFTDHDEEILLRLSDHAAIAIQNATLFSRLQGLSGRLLEVQEAERRHLARELHDEIGQLLTGLRFTLDVPEPPSPTLHERLVQAQTIVQELLERVRALSLDLRPSILDDLGVLPALLGHIERYTSQTKIRVHLEHSGLDRRFAPETETGVYRIVQEALTNVARHGRVDEVTVRLWASDDVLGVQVEDHGAGFDPGATFGSGRSGGLAGLRERAALLNGHLTVESRPGRGVRLTAEVPLNGALRRGE